MGIEWKDIEYFTDGFNSRTRTLIDLLVDSELKQIQNMIDIGCGMMFCQKFCVKFCQKLYK